MESKLKPQKPLNMNAVLREHQEMMEDTECQDFKVVWPNDRFQHAFLGMMDELGEMAKGCKKTGYTGEPLDMENMFEECGDFFYFYRLLLDSLGFTLKQVAGGNIKKLRKRYGDKFSVEKFKNRDTEAEMSAMSGGESINTNDMEVEKDSPDLDLLVVTDEGRELVDGLKPQDLFCSECGVFVTSSANIPKGSGGQGKVCKKHPGAMLAVRVGLMVLGVEPKERDEEDDEEGSLLAVRAGLKVLGAEPTKVSKEETRLVNLISAEIENSKSEALFVSYTERARKNYSVVLKSLLYVVEQLPLGQQHILDILGILDGDPNETPLS